MSAPTVVADPAPVHWHATRPLFKTQQPVWSNTDKLDGGKVWKVKCAGNPMTFESIYNSNHTTDVSLVESSRGKVADETWAQLKA